jgi:hypothetical protein
MYKELHGSAETEGAPKTHTHTRTRAHTHTHTHTHTHLQMYKELHGNAETEGAPKTPADRELLTKRTLLYLERAEDVCNRAGVFSENETVEVCVFGLL